MNILFISHKLPYPPNKGEKIRAFNIVKYLSRDHRVFLYSLCDDGNGLLHQEELEQYCASVNIYNIRPFFSNLRAATYLFTTFPFTFAYFFSYRMARDIRRILQRIPFDLIFACCSSSAQYVLDNTEIKKCVDFVDIDSDKWASFAKKRTFPFSLIYKIEAQR